MANTYVDYTATAGQTDFNFSFPFLEDSHVVVEVEGVNQTLTTNYTIETSPVQKIVLSSPTTAIAGGELVRIKRVSDPTTNLVDFVNGSVLTETELDRAYLHNRYLAEEAYDGVNAGLRELEGSTNYNANNKQIKNLADGTLATDAVNKGYVDTQIALTDTNLAGFYKSTHTGNGTDNVFTLSFTPQTTEAEAYIVSIDGLVQVPDTDYTIGATAITFNTIPTNLAEICVVATAAASVATVNEAQVTATGSSEPRSLANRFADVVNVLDYGATGDGDTDDTDEIQAALNAATSSSTALDQHTLPMVDGANKAYKISSPLEITGCGLQNITLIVDTTYSDVVLYLKRANSRTFRNITIKTDRENDPAATREDKEGAYTGIRLDHNGVAAFDNLFEKISINRPNVGILFDESVSGAGGFTTSNNFNNCSILGFVTALKAATGTSLTFLNYFNNCYFYNQRSVDTVLFQTDNAVSYQNFNNCSFWQDGATTATLLESDVQWLQPLIYINEGYWEIDSFELLDNAVSFSSVGLVDKDQGEYGTADSTLLPHVTSNDLKNLVPTTDITRWTVGTNWTKDTKTFRGNAVYKVTAGTTARIDLNFDKQDYSSRWTYSFSGWMKTDAASTSYIYLEVRYSDGSSSFQSSNFAKADDNFRLIGTKLTFDVDTTKTVDRVIGYIVPGSATDCYFSSAAICQSTKIPLIAQEEPFNVVSDNALDNIDIVRESDGTSILTGKTITNPYFYQFGELCYITGEISWSGVTGTSTSLTRISGLPFFGDSNARGLGMFITAADGDINSFEVVNDGTGYIFKNGSTIASNAFPTSGSARISLVYRIQL